MRGAERDPVAPLPLARLGQWLAPRLGPGVSDVRVGEPGPPDAGQSSDTLVFDAQWLKDEKRCHGGFVMKRQPPTDRIFLDADVLDEYRTLRALAGTGVPVPAMIGAEEDPAVLGARLFVMARVPGTVPTGKPSIHTAGWLPTLTAAERRIVWSSALDALVAVHRTDWRGALTFLPGADEALGAGKSGPGAAGQALLTAHVGRLGRWYRWATAGRSFPVTDAAWEYLRAGLPDVRGSEPVLLWGDARPGNMIFGADLSAAAVIDWEVAAIGPAEIDVAHWLVFDEFATSSGVPRLPGFPGREAILDHYGRVAGRTPQCLDYFEVLQAFFLATTLIRQADLGVRAGRFPAGTDMGRGNAITQSLARRLGLPVPELSADYLRHRTPHGSASTGAAL
ncbi:phosphotransferase family protein [Streptomyces sp. NPDC059262]|uniref:phosphotransferase family protein n=1 Tax=Streptomyces sp. NPDC059262 TaxID=3346797 RepID=UPI00367D42A3